MLRSLQDLEGYHLAAVDDDIGKVHDFLFDDETWVLRYLVADTGTWLPGRKVLLSPSVLNEPNWSKRSLSISLTREQIESSPDIDSDQPVSRQREQELRSHYGWPIYWTASSAYAGGVPPSPPPVTPRVKPPDSGKASESSSGDPHLRSVKEIRGYGIRATDGDIGAVDDVIADDESWSIRYLVVSTRKWLPGRRVLIAPEWLVGPIDWTSKRVTCNMTKESIRQSPEFDPAMPINRKYETILYDYYGRPGYWM